MHYIYHLLVFLIFLQSGRTVLLPFHLLLWELPATHTQCSALLSPSASSHLIFFLILRWELGTVMLRKRKTSPNRSRACGPRCGTSLPTLNSNSGCNFWGCVIDTAAPVLLSGHSHGQEAALAGDSCRVSCPRDTHATCGAAPVVRSWGLTPPASTDLPATWELSKTTAELLLNPWPTENWWPINLSHCHKLSDTGILSYTSRGNNLGSL